MIKRNAYSQKRAANKTTLYRPHYQLKQMLWDFHLADADDQIAIPHGHSLNGKVEYTLDPYTGDVYHNKIKQEYGLIKKEYNRLWEDNKFLKYVKRARNTYLEHNPGVTLPSIPIIASNQNKILISGKNSRIKMRFKRFGSSESDDETFRISLLTTIRK